MFSTALVIFRESFEIALIIGVVLAATRGLPGRGIYIAGGAFTGALGAFALAAGMQRISGAFEGMGQELMNASVLIAAALCIGWTVVWMRTHAREMAQRLQATGQAVLEERLPCYALSAIIAVAVLREGAEIALFLLGMLASGKAAVEIVTGASLGAAAGVCSGALLYLGLVRIPTRYFFAVTSWMLVFLVSGLMALAAGYLVAAGYFQNASDVVWDTGGVLSESSLLGQTLHVLLGYIAQPMEAQVAAYLGTFALLALLLRWTRGREEDARIRPQMVAAVLLLAACAVGALPGQAHATKRIYSPYVEQGEVELEVLGSHYFDDRDDEDGGWKYKTAIGYGVTNRWFTELYLEREKEGVSGADADTTAVEWENRFQLSEQGEYPVDLGFYVAYEHALTRGSADKIEAKMLLAKDSGAFTHLANLELEQHLGRHTDGEGIEGGFALGTRYRLSPWFSPGVEWHGDFSELRNTGGFDRQSHQAGPAFYGEIPGTGFSYDVGYLFGVSDAAVDGELKFILEYGFRF
jgi:high-affinity iron transporter